MRFLSVCSGIEAASVAWNPLGWEAAAFAEIEPFPSAVLAHHYPHVPNRGDMTKFAEWPDDAIDLLCGGTPCQSFSVAGLRKGLDDPRGNLMLTFGAIAARYRPRWLVWENVPGVLSSNEGRDFGAFLGMLGQLGYGFAYRVLDAQFFGVAQRRRRVFVVGCLGDWRSAAAVLFERHSLSGHPAPRRQAGQRTAERPGISAAVSSGHGWWDESDVGATIRAQDSVTKADTLVANTLLGKENSSHAADQETHIAHSLRGEGFDASEDGTGRGTPLVPVHAFDARQSDVIQYGDKTGPLDTDGHSIGVLSFGSKDHGADASFELAPTLRAGGHAESHANAGVPPAVMQAMQVRRLTPEECEALQGFPRSYTAIPWRGKPADQCPDGPRYKALGNSWAVPCARWIGERIEAVKAITRMKEAA